MTESDIQSRNGAPYAVIPAVAAGGGSGELPEVDASGNDLGTTGLARIVREADGSFVEIVTSNNETVTP